MLTRWVVLLIGLAVAAPAAAEEMRPERARRFTVGKLFAFSCFDGTRGIGSIYGDGSVAGTIQFRATGPERTGWLRPGTVKVKGEAVCASLDGLPLEPCFKFKRTGDHSFRASVWGFDTAYCDFIRHLDSETDIALYRRTQHRWSLAATPVHCWRSRPMLSAPRGRCALARGWLAGPNHPYSTRNVP